MPWLLIVCQPLSRDGGARRAADARRGAREGGRGVGLAAHAHKQVRLGVFDDGQPWTGGTDPGMFEDSLHVSLFVLGP